MPRSRAMDVLRSPLLTTSGALLMAVLIMSFPSAASAADCLKFPYTDALESFHETGRTGIASSALRRYVGQARSRINVVLKGRGLVGSKVVDGAVDILEHRLDGTFPKEVRDAYVRFLVTGEAPAQLAGRQLELFALLTAETRGELVRRLVIGGVGDWSFIKKLGSKGQSHSQAIYDQMRRLRRHYENHGRTEDVDLWIDQIIGHMHFSGYGETWTAGTYHRAEEIANKILKTGKATAGSLRAVLVGQLLSESNWCDYAVRYR